MAATNPPMLHVTCPQCRAVYDFPAEMAGRSGPCAECGATFTIHASGASPASTRPTQRAGKPSDPSTGGGAHPAASAKPSSDDGPQWSSVDCRVCGTRLTGPIRQVGKAIKCPDCGARTVLTPPPPPKRKNIPAAMEGEQYELWDVDEAPLPSELIRREPKYIPISCRLCHTLMQATEQQIGQSIACPDCGTRHLVALPSPPSRLPEVDVAGEPLLLEPAVRTDKNVPIFVPPRRRMLYEEEEEAERARRESATRQGKKRATQYDERGRPIMPSQPLASGIVSFLVSPGVPVRWGVLAIVLGLAGWMGIQGVSIAMTGGFGAIAGMCFYAIAVVSGFLWSAATTSIYLAIVVESSEGNDQVYNWPTPNFFDWLPELGYMLVAILVSAFPGWSIAWLADGAPPWLAPALFFGSILVCLPVVILSQLDIGTPFGVISGRVLASMTRCPVSWLLLYVQVTLIGAVLGGIVLLSAQVSDGFLLLLPVAGVAALILHARLIGRLGWKLAEAMSVVEDDDSA